MKRIILASGSPQRQQLLKNIFNHFEIAAADIDESLLSDERLEASVERLARAKAETVAGRIGDPASLIIAGDTLVEAGGRILGKPGDAAEAAEFIRSFAGGSARIATGIAAVSNGKTESEVDVAEVFFAPMTESEIESYITENNATQLAGGMKIENSEKWIRRIDGDLETIIGLPTRLVAELAKKFD